ncbi:MAG: hypothetical protein ACLUFP_08975 [Streptococcus salivarius]
MNGKWYYLMKRCCRYRCSSHQWSKTLLQ